MSPDRPPIRVALDEADKEIRDRLSADAYQHFLRARRGLLKIDRSKVGSDA